MNYSKKHVKLLCYRFFRYEKSFKNYKGRKNLYLSLVAEIEEAAQYGAFHKCKLKMED